MEGGWEKINFYHHFNRNKDIWDIWKLRSQVVTFFPSKSPGHPLTTEHWTMIRNRNPLLQTSIWITSYCSDHYWSCCFTDGQTLQPSSCQTLPASEIASLSKVNAISAKKMVNNDAGNVGHLSSSITSAAVSRGMWASDTCEAWANFHSLNCSIVSVFSF